jgi:hypothetical protein
MILQNKKKVIYQFYGITKDPISVDYMLVFRHIQYLYFKCQYLPDFFDWCEICKLKYFQLNYGEFPSGSNDIDHFLKVNYCKSRSPEEIIEWIPYNEFKNITHIAVNEETYNAVWSKGCISDWDKIKFSWNRASENLVVTLINFKDLEDLYNIYKVSSFFK